MDEEKVKEIVRQMLAEKSTADSFAAYEVPNHIHNGLDSSRVSQADIVTGLKYSTLLTEDESETFYLRGVFNATRLVFQGFAANNADGSPASHRALLNGEVNFGSGFQFSGTGSTITIDGTGQSVPFVQSSNGVYLDGTAGSPSDPTRTRVSASTDNFAYAEDNTSAVFASLQLLSYDGETLAIQAVVLSNVKIQGALTIY